MVRLNPDVIAHERPIGAELFWREANLSKNGLLELEG